jgi:hypothetical protein
MGQIEKLEKEIKRLEEKLSKDHFGGLVDNSGRKRDEKKLFKLMKELEKLKKSK